MKITNIGIALIILSIIGSLSNLTLTGAIIGTRSRTFNALLLTFLVVGIGLLTYEGGRKLSGRRPELLAYLPRDCLERGVEIGGSDPNNLVVPAFNPKKFSPEKIKKSFNFGDDRVLVKYCGKSLRKFHERPTGPENKPLGIYACNSYVPPEDIKQVDERKYQ